MKNINHIDELLKNSFNGFEANPPANVWSQIQQSISNSPTIHSQNAAAKTATVVKSASVIIKVAIIAATSSVVLGGGFLAYKYFNKTSEVETKIAVQQIQTPQNIEQKVDENSPEQNQKSKISESKKIISTSHQNENKKVDNVSDEKLNINAADNENKTAIIQTPTLPVNEPNKTVSKPEKPEQKQVLPKPKHNFAAPENNSPSNSVYGNENNFAAPKIPNSFSPNGDGINDKFEIKIDNETYYDLKIYDHQNHLVFESDNKEKVWDGTKMNLGELCEEGDYYFVFNFQYKNTEKVNTKRGAIKIIR